MGVPTVDVHVADDISWLDTELRDKEVTDAEAVFLGEKELRPDPYHLCIFGESIPRYPSRRLTHNYTTTVVYNARRCENSSGGARKGKYQAPGAKP